MRTLAAQSQKPIFYSILYHALLVASFLVAAPIAAQVLPGSILWLRADTGIVLQGGLITRWKDLSGHGNDANMSILSQEPALLPSASNGKPSVSFGGGRYLNGSPCFPAHHDYTICIVAKINVANNTNNLVSGSDHAIWFDNSLYPQVLHSSFFRQDHGTIAVWPTGFSTIDVLYSEADQQAQLFVNGEFADSSYIQSTSDSTLLIGAFRGGYWLLGEIQEILMYDREVDSSERIGLDNFLRSTYSIPHGLPNPKPDSTFEQLPKQLQVYGRGADDSATVPISGTMYETGFDSIYLLQYKNGILLQRVAQALQYTDGVAKFAFLPRTHAELSEYRFEVHGVRGAFDSLLIQRDSIVCGDMFLVDGQSDAAFGYDTSRYLNEFCRSFGMNYSQDHRDTAWAVAQTYKWGDGPSTGAWGQRIQRNLVEREQIPSCCINGAVSATNIGSHEPNDTNHYNLQTIYGRQLYRANQSGLRDAVHAIFWEQGEANYATGYYDKFLKLYHGWKSDYPGLKRIYLVQNRPNFCYWFNPDMRDVQRAMGDSLPDVEPIAKAAIAGYDGCHFQDFGFDSLGDRLFLPFARDIYHASDTSDIRCPNAIFAYYTTASHNQIAVLFSPRGVALHSTPDTTENGIFATLKDYFYVDDPAVHTQSISFDRDTLFINLDQTAHATAVQYLPDQHYNGSDTVIYEGPWIVNSRGYGALLWYHLPIHWWPLAVRPDAPNLSLAIYPNPTTHSVQIDWPQAVGALRARIINELGAVVWSQSMGFSGSAVTLDFGPLPAGAYLLELTSGSLRERRKILISP